MEVANTLIPFIHGIRVGKGESRSDLSFSCNTISDHSGCGGTYIYIYHVITHGNKYIFYLIFSGGKAGARISD